MSEEYDAIKKMLILHVEESTKQKYNGMVTKKSWAEFKNTGLILFINSILHAFGWAIVFETTETGDIASVYPARVKFRGFNGEDTSDAHAKIANYLKDNIDDLVEEVNS